MKVRGACGCGAVTFEVDGEPKWQGYCHCRSCQKAHAAPVFAGAIFAAEDFSHTGEVKKVTVTDGERATARFICTSCGTKVFNAPMPIIRTIFVSLCDETDWFQPQTHLYWEHRITDVADDLPKYLDFPEAYGGSGRLAE